MTNADAKNIRIERERLTHVRYAFPNPRESFLDCGAIDEIYGEKRTLEVTIRVLLVIRRGPGVVNGRERLEAGRKAIPHIIRKRAVVLVKSERLVAFKSLSTERVGVGVIGLQFCPAATCYEVFGGLFVEEQRGVAADICTIYNLTTRLTW